METLLLGAGGCLGLLVAGFAVAWRARSWEVRYLEARLARLKADLEEALEQADASADAARAVVEADRALDAMEDAGRSPRAVRRWLLRARPGDPPPEAPGTPA